MSKLPAFQFYPGDWLKDPALRACSLAARGLWVDLLCFMHESSTRGELRHANGAPIHDAQAARIVGCAIDQFLALKKELHASGVFSIADDGAMVSRRMKRDEVTRNIRKGSGTLGGNPRLVRHYNGPGFVYAARAKSGLLKLGVSMDPQSRTYRIRHENPGEDVTLVGKWEVSDMGKAEESLHHKFADQRKNGEWFDVGILDIERHLQIFLKEESKEDGAGLVKQIQTPSSSTSVSSSEIPTPAARRVRAEEFERFWLAYPKKKNREAARKAWAKVSEPIETILEAVAKQRKTADWLKEAGQFIPHAASWLNGRRWEDEITLFSAPAIAPGSRAAGQIGAPGRYAGPQPLIQGGRA